MMSKDFLKKAGILGVSFGLVASPLAFAQTDDDSAIEENRGVTIDEQPLEPQSTDGVTSEDSHESKDSLTQDVGDDVSDAEPHSEDGPDNAEFEKDELVEENGGTN